MCNFVISLLWLLYIVFLRNLWTNASDDPNQVELYIYFLNLAIALAFIPLFLCTYLLIAAGNLTTLRMNSNGLHKHNLSPLAVNSLLVVVFPALFLLLFVPGIVSGQMWSSYIGFVGEFEDQAIQNATAFAAAGDLSEPTRQAAITDMLSLVDSTLNPRRLDWIKMQRVMRICELPAISTLLLVRAAPLSRRRAYSTDTPPSRSTSSGSSSFSAMFVKTDGASSSLPARRSSHRLPHWRRLRSAHRTTPSARCQSCRYTRSRRGCRWARRAARPSLRRRRRTI